VPLFVRLDGRKVTTAGASALATTGAATVVMRPTGATGCSRRSPIPASR
jgi:hypothetical protein